MTPERWQQISRIFKSAMSLDGEARDDYLKGVDSSLRAEVDKLLDSHQKASDEKFIDGMAAEANAVLLIDEDALDEEPANRLNKGQHLGSYVVLDALGAGGMGQVYLATDTRLDRTVALKVLSEEVASDHRRMQRFRQEAKIVSSLNQPNILTIYEFAEVDGLTFLATEFIDGETLRSYLQRQRLKVGEILDIAIQVLAALDAAHEAHIVHRDIKPENVMIRKRDRVVKVLDFGLAKATAERKSSGFGEAATEFKTAPHMLMGTINYMSPEQAQAHPVDVRTDIWSSGVMIYEMVSGLLPFKGSTVSHTIVQIIEKDPVPLTQFKKRNAPAELQRIVSKALAKSLDERYQTAKDMLIDLRSLKKRLDVEAEIDRTSTPGMPRPTIASEEEAEEEVPVPQKKHVLAIAMVAMVIATAGIFAFSVWQSSRARTTPAPTVVPPVPVEERTLSYSITVQRFRDGNEYEKPFTLPGEIVFEADYEIQLEVRTPQTGHLYIYNEGPPEAFAPVELVVLFPTKTANKGSSLLAANQVVQIPEESRFKLDKQKGTEIVWLVFSADTVPELEAIGAANPDTQGLIKDPARNKVIQDFLTKHSAQKPSVDKDDKQTTLKSTGKLLIHAVKLAHY